MPLFLLPCITVFSAMSSKVLVGCCQVSLKPSSSYPGSTHPFPSASLCRANASALNQLSGLLLNSFQFLHTFACTMRQNTGTKYSVCSPTSSKWTRVMTALSLLAVVLLVQIRMLFASFGCQGTVLARFELALCQDPQAISSRAAPQPGNLQSVLLQGAKKYSINPNQPNEMVFKERS